MDAPSSLTKGDIFDIYFTLQNQDRRFKDLLKKINERHEREKRLYRERLTVLQEKVTSFEKLMGVRNVIFPMSEKLSDWSLGNPEENLVENDSRCPQTACDARATVFEDETFQITTEEGVDFTLMVIGESGVGKSTLIKSLTSSYTIGNVKETENFEVFTHCFKHESVDLKLCLIDTPGFGDEVDNSNCWQPMIEFIESRFEEYSTAENGIDLKPTSDTRVHCCLYFIAPGRRLKPRDVHVMKRLHQKVNVIPVIAKGDTMISEETVFFKKQILNDIAQHNINIYGVECINEENSKIPFAVFGSPTIFEIDGVKVRGRKYPWGVAQVENPEHNDFIALRDMILKTHMQDLKDVTNNIFYSNYKCCKISDPKITKK